MTTLQITTGQAELDTDLVYRFLSEQSSWAKGLPRPVFDRAIANSLCFGVYLDDRQIGFARVVTDCATFANLVDVFVLPQHRGSGYSKQLMAAVLAHPDLQGLRRFTLATGDAHGLYAQFGFNAPLRPASLMERYRPDIYNGQPIQ
jgi:GNAT superfamily N-acetyltransferase